MVVVEMYESLRTAAALRFLMMIRSDPLIEFEHREEMT
jgi:hypothetical protein